VEEDFGSGMTVQMTLNGRRWAEKGCPQMIQIGADEVHRSLEAEQEF
jgi:hypothetical protein